MCGIAGFFGSRQLLGAEALRSNVLRMAKAIEHRGPDGYGAWTDASCGLALGHRRLAVIELSEAGAQPMLSACGRFVLTFNGEIYNAPELRSRLDAEAHIPWRGHSDTEVLVEAVARWGLEDTLRACVGMFAFAIWDRVERILSLARDRVGEKPLFYGWSGSTFMFGSELKALRAHPDWEAAIDRQSLLEYTRFSYVTAPRSIFVGISKLPPACYTQIAVGARPGQVGVPRKYWTVFPARTGPDQSGNGQGIEASILSLEAKLTTAVKAQLAADVPVGAFLSGGLDSTMIVALAQRCSAQPLSTFTIGFHEPGYDETSHAAVVARFLGTRHTEAHFSSRDALNIIPALSSLYDEPHADSSQLPTYFVSRLAREHVTVALTGDGGDELLCGYSNYFTADRIWRSIRALPRGVRLALAESLRFGTNTLRSAHPRRTLDKLYKVSTCLDVGNQAEVFECLVDSWRGCVPVTHADRLSWWRSEARELMALDPWLGMSMQDLVTYMPDAILAKVDRASMAVSLETRVPFLDHRVVEYAMSLPTGFKVSDGRGKFLLRQLLGRYMPAEMMDRPKSGFSVPIGIWLREPLRDWAEDLLDETRLREDGYFDVSLVRRRWSEHLRGYGDWKASLWNVLMFQAWLREQGTSRLGNEPLSPSSLEHVQ
jgi:asparagine synthase (glutamine-hydrolysing)